MTDWSLINNYPPKTINYFELFVTNYSNKKSLIVDIIFWNNKVFGIKNLKKYNHYNFIIIVLDYHFVRLMIRMLYLI